MQTQKVLTRLCAAASTNSASVRPLRHVPCFVVSGRNFFSLFGRKTRNIRKIPIDDGEDEFMVAPKLSEAKVDCEPVFDDMLEARRFRRQRLGQMQMAEANTANDCDEENTVCSEPQTGGKTTFAKKSELQYTSERLLAGLSEQIYESTRDKYLHPFRMLTFTPLTVGLLFVPKLVLSYEELDAMSKVLLAAAYFCTSAAFPLFGFRAVRNHVSRVWLSADRQSLKVEKLSFLFGMRSEKLNVADLKLLPEKGLDKNTFFECRRTKRQFLMEAQQLRHPVWLEILDISDAQIYKVKSELLYAGLNQGTTTNLK